MSLHSEVGAADKPELVMLHGWGAHSGAWQTVLDELAEDFSVTRIDLPGHGHSPFDTTAPRTLDDWAEQVLAVAPARATWLGWSLGGLVAQRVATLAPERVERLVLVGSSLKFVRDESWPDAVDAHTFGDFHAAVIDDPRGSLLRFIALQTRGSATASQDVRVLRKALLDPAPLAAALDAGMQLLVDTDLRDNITSITCPVLLLGGGRDTLVPRQALGLMQAEFADADLHVIEQAGHAPFISHPAEFCDVVKTFAATGGVS